MEKSPERRPAELELTLPATMEGLAAALDAIENYCAGLNGNSVSRARIAVEELFSNTIKYGYGGECGKLVRLRLAASPGLVITYEDDAPPFDPTRWKSQEIEDLLPDRRAEGRTGIAMVMGLCAKVTWRTRGVGNSLVLTFP